jgi:hypothetical protein
MTLFRLTLLAGLFTLATGCTADKGDDTGDTGGNQTLSIENEGFACLSDDGTDDLSTGAVRVVLADSLSGCAEDLAASCEATVTEGGVLQVTASGSYSVPTGKVDCLAVCVALVAECEATGLSEEVTILRYADVDVAIDFPASEVTCTVPSS